MTERTIPILPCKSINETLDFYRALGFEVTYQQKSPNTYAVVERGAIELQFFVLKALDPANSYSTCYVMTSDVDSLYEAFRGGLRAATGRVPLRGVPRIGALKDMSYGVRQFIVTDPGGNMIRIGQPLEAADPVVRPSRLARALETAVLLGDSKGDHLGAAKTLDRALNADDDAPRAIRFRALVFRADLALRMDERNQAQVLLDQAAKIELSAADQPALRDDLERVRDLRDDLSRGPRSQPR